MRVHLSLGASYIAITYKSIIVVVFVFQSTIKIHTLHIFDIHVFLLFGRHLFLATFIIVHYLLT